MSTVGGNIIVACLCDILVEKPSQQFTTGPTTQESDMTIIDKIPGNLQ